MVAFLQWRPAAAAAHSAPVAVTQLGLLPTTSFAFCMPDEDTAVSGVPSTESSQVQSQIPTLSAALAGPGCLQLLAAFFPFRFARAQKMFGA